ncbi:MAG TPA: sialidase family protein [Frankiaceae bacterium]|nr:sialidase family protein [Frankiaceae bacterium]
MKITRSRLRALLVAATLVAAPIAVSQPGTAAAARKAVVHGPNAKPAKARYSATPKMFRLKHGAGEPTLGIDKQGEIFVTASDGCVTSCPGSTEAISTVAPGGRVVYASDNQGKSWRNVTPGVGDVSPHVISVDPYIWVDEHKDGNRIFNIDLTLACSILSFSDDGAQTWTTNPLACGEPVNDHQTLFGGVPKTSPTIGYPHVLYYCFNHPAFTKCTKSLDGGLTFVPTAQIEAPACGGLNGHGVVDSKGTVYVPLASCGQPFLAISNDEGDSWRNVRVHPESANGDPSVAVDAKGNLYYLWVEATERTPYLSVSRNGGRTWSKPVMVAPKGVQATNLATLDVGAPGKIAIAYYGTTDEEDPEHGWSGYIASGIDVLTTRPTFYTATVNDPRNPLKMGNCGTPGGSNRCGRVLDYIDVEIAPNGQPWATFVDACAATCEKTKKESIQDNEGVIGTLTGGPNLVKLK